MAKITRDLVVIGASAGGVQALQLLVSKLPEDFPAAVCVVLHLWAGSESYLAQILARASRLPAIQPRDGDSLERGRIYVAPRDFHLLVEPGKLVVVHGPRENRFRPAINPLFRSAAAAYRNRVVGVILTGMLDDGAAGLWAVKRCGGIAVVQANADFDQMPQAARHAVAVDHVVPLAGIPELLERLVREPIAFEERGEVPDIVRIGVDGVKVQSVNPTPDKAGRLSGFSCPDCGGALWEVDEGQMQYRCHVGHAFSPDGLRDAQSSNIEESLWSALRALKERAALDERLAHRSEEHGLSLAAEVYQQSAQQKKFQAHQVREFLRQLRPETFPDPMKKNELLP